MIVTIIGARPQFIKAAIVSKALLKRNIEERILHTGQHYDEQMSDVFFRELGLPPYEKNLNVGSGTHAKQTADMMINIEEYLLDHQERIKAVLLYGDTNSTLAGALVAAKLGIKIIHIEAGLRSFNKSMPEEVNRIITDHLSDILFCPSIQSVNQLRQEGITRGVYETGDVMYDALLHFKGVVDKFDSKNIYEGSFALLTIHRPSNTDDPSNLDRIFDALSKSSVPLVWPIHPRALKVIKDNGKSIPANIIVKEPFSYFEMLRALNLCERVITDSGGVQKEAYWMKKPCITLRSETEWIETLHHNWNTVVGTDANKIEDALKLKIDPNTWTELYGRGSAAEQIADVIAKI